MRRRRRGRRRARGPSSSLTAAPASSLLFRHRRRRHHHFPIRLKNYCYHHRGQAMPVHCHYHHRLDPHLPLLIDTFHTFIIIVSSLFSLFSLACSSNSRSSRRRTRRGESCCSCCRRSPSIIIVRIIVVLVPNWQNSDHSTNSPPHRDCHWPFRGVDVPRLDPLVALPHRRSVKSFECVALLVPRDWALHYYSFPHHYPVVPFLKGVFSVQQDRFQ